MEEKVDLSGRYGGRTHFIRRPASPGGDRPKTAGHLAALQAGTGQRPAVRVGPILLGAGLAEQLREVEPALGRLT
jgi:hypothetical protein